MKHGDTNDDSSPTVEPPLLPIPPIGEPLDAAAQSEPPLTDGTLPSPDQNAGVRTAAAHPRDDADRVRGEIVAESIAQHADHAIGSRLGPLMQRAVRVRALDDDLIRANAAAELVETQPGGPPAPTTWRGRLSARMLAGGGLLALFFAVGQKAVGKNLRLAQTRDTDAPADEAGGEPDDDRRRPLLEGDLSAAARYAVTVAIIVTGLGLWYGIQSARTTANNAASAREAASQAAGARGAAAQRLAQQETPDSSAPGVYFLVSASVFLLGIGVAYLLSDPVREARQRRRRRDTETLEHRDRVRLALAAEVGALVSQRAEIATTVANAKRQMHQEAVMHPDVSFLQRADAFPHYYGTWRPRSSTPFSSTPEVGEAHHAHADLADSGGLTVPDKLADVDALIAELLGRNLGASKGRLR